MYNQNNLYNPYLQQQYQNLYGNQMNPTNQLTPRQQVIRVNGKNGADTYQMAPNSSILLLDETAPIVWLKTTDGAGYATVTAYDIAPHQEEKPVDTKSLQARISRLEEIINEQQSDARQAQSTRKITTVTRKSESDKNNN